MKMISSYIKKIRQNYFVFGLFVIIGIHIYLLTRITFFPYPELFVYSYLTDKGLLPYKQIFDQHFPGIMFFPINLASLGFDTPQEAQMIHLILIFLNHVIIFLIAKRLLKSNYIALLSNVFYLVWQPFLEGYVLWIESFVTPLILLTFFVISSKKDSIQKYFLSGLIMGIAFVFKQVLVILILLIVLFLTIKKNKKKVLLFIAGILIPVALMVIYIFGIGVFPDFYYWTYLFNITTFAQEGRKYPATFDLIKGFWIFFPVIILFLHSFIRGKLKDLGLLIFLGLVGSFAFAYARFDFIHLQPALPFAAILSIALVKHLPKSIYVFIIPFYILGSIFFLKPFYDWGQAQSKVIFFGDFEYKISMQVMKYSKSGDSVFSFGSIPHLNYFTKTLPPGRVFVFQFPWFMHVAEDKVLEGIINDPPKVVVRDKVAQVQGMNLVENMPNINKYINDNYEVVDSVDNAQIMIRRD